MVIVLQADMWDPAAIAPADRSSSCGSNHCHWLNSQHPVRAELDAHHVQSSTTKPGEWLRLTIDTRMPGVFSWKNVPYCNDP